MHLNPNQFTLDLQFDAPLGDMQSPPANPRATPDKYAELRSTYFSPVKKRPERVIDGSKWARFHSGA